MPVRLERADDVVGAIDRARQGLERTAVVGISGADCAGKSTLASWLAARLAERGTPAAVVAGDDYLLPRHIRRANTDQARGYYAESFDYAPLVANVLEPARAGAPGGVLLVEGVFLFTRELLPRFDVALWIDAAPDETLARARRRAYDLDRYGGAEAVEREYRRRFLPGQALHLELDRPHERAHAVLPAGRVPVALAR